MTRYIARRLLWLVALLFIVSALTFLVFFLLPSADPAQLRAGRQPNPELVEEIRHNLGLDEPWYVQYATYARALVTRFDLGTSYQSNVPVRDEILERLPATASLVAGAALLSLVTGVVVGVVSAVRRRTAVDRASMGAALVAISAPPYWLGLVALYLFASDIGRVPIFAGAGSYAPLSEDPGQWLGSLILPWIVLAAAFAAFYARLLRANMIEVMGEDYIRTARAKGLTERRVILRHGVRSAITPVVSAAGLDIGLLLGGAILVETVFNIPGIGRLAFEAIRSSDLPMIQGTVLFGALFIMVANLLVDVAYAFLDPRVRHA
ncbi:MAG: ABC transporter permease [Actinomycetota bacterium]|nr:ABC transporter permease [Actinomycetota bacterium]